jgi:GT2 family glycosyltransferase
MTPKTPATAIVVTHDSAGRIAATLDALLDDPTGPAEVIVVDNASADDTGRVVAVRPVRWLPLETNHGFGIAVNAGAAQATHDVIAVLNHDVVVTAGWLPPLLAALGGPAVGAAMATVELADRPGHFNTSGGALSVAGMAWVTGLGDPIPPVEPAAVDVPFPSGAAFAVRGDTWRRLGGFRDDFFMYHEDTDLGWRLRLLGLRTVRVPASRVSHHYEFGRNRDKLALLERNRLRMIATNYRRSTIALLAPVLALHEAGLVWVSLRDRWFRAKVRAWRAGLLGGEARRRHREVQATRVVGDAEILAGMTGAVSMVPIPEVRVPRGGRIVDRVTRAYVAAVLPLIRRIDRRRGVGPTA